MGNDRWLDPGTCGVKLGQFEQMSRQMSQASPRLESLAHHLWQALNGAGVSTAPAMEILRISRWAQQASVDLQRRNRLAHNLDRQNLAFWTCRKEGNYVILPDRYTDQLSYADGRHLGTLLSRAGDGDRKALAELQRVDPKSINAQAAKAILETLGPQGLVSLPMDLAQDIKADINADRDGLDQRARDTRAALALMKRSLDLGTNPDGRAFVGHAYLTGLRHAGQSTFPPGSAVPNGVAGYQGLATILNAEGNARFSPTFFKTVGHGMIAYDRTARASLHGKALPDLAGVYDLGNALDNGTTSVSPGERNTDFLNPMLATAATSGREAAQALLNPNLIDRTTDLHYLLSERRSVWAHSDKGTALGQAIKTAATGRDETSVRIAFTASDIIANDATKYFKVENQKLKIAHKDELDAIARLRPYMADVLAAHIGKINSVYGANTLGAPAASSPMNEVDLDYLFLDISRDRNAFNMLLKAQAAHAKVHIDHAVSARSSSLRDIITAEAQVFGHLLETHNQTVAAESDRVATNNQELKNLVNQFVGLIPVPGASKVAQLGSQTAEAVYDTTIQALLSKIGAHASNTFMEQPNPVATQKTTNAEAIEKLFGQIITSSLATHRDFDPKILQGKSFASKSDDSRIESPEKLDPDVYEELALWAGVHLHTRSLQGTAKNQLNSGIIDTVGHIRSEDGTSNVKPSDQR